MHKKPFVSQLFEIQTSLLGVILLPALDLDVLELHRAEGLDECLGKAHVGHQGNIVVDGTTTDAITIGELALGLVLRHVDDKVELMVGYHVHHLVISILIRP